METTIKKVGKISVHVVTDKRDSLLSKHLITESDAEWIAEQLQQLELH